MESGSIIKQRMLDLGFTPETLASEIGVGIVTMKNILRNMRPRRSTARLLCRVLELKLEELFPELAAKSA